MKKSEKETRVIKSLSISIGIYIVVTLLLIGLVIAKDWTSLWQILTIPSVYVVLLAFLVVNLLTALPKTYPIANAKGIPKITETTSIEMYCVRRVVRGRTSKLTFSIFIELIETSKFSP